MVYSSLYVLKSIGRYGGCSATKNNVLKSGAVAEGIVTDSGNGIGDADTGSLIATIEGIGTDIGNTGFDDDGSDGSSVAIPTRIGTGIVLHSSGAVDGENATGIQHPSAIVAAGTPTVDRIIGALGFVGRWAQGRPFLSRTGVGDQKTAAATGECGGADGSDTVRNGDAAQIGTAGKRAGSDRQ